MNFKYQLPAFLLAAFLIRPLLADDVPQRNVFGDDVETEPTASAEQRGATTTKDKEGKEPAKKAQKKDAGKELRELFEKQLGHPIRKAL